MIKFKIKKKLLIIITLLYILLTMFELIKYLLIDRNIFGLIYLLISLFIIFLLVPTCYNYKKHYSKNRISKLIIIIILGLFSSFILEYIINNIINYIDYSNIYIKSILLIKNIIKPILYTILILFILIETNTIKINNKN